MNVSNSSSGSGSAGGIRRIHRADRERGKRGCAGGVKQKIQQKLAEGFQLDGQLIRVFASSGIALFPDDGDTPEALIKQADLRMYADRQSRRAGARQN
jgi:predicted signal transduction protein with EAL and GGDEF domain